MESILDCYFDNVFEELPRGSLLSRQKRQELTEYFSMVIEACASAEECSISDGCKTAVSAAISYHNVSKNENGGVCRMGKFHDVLYLGMKLCFDFRLDDTGIVSELLNAIFGCEKSFERISAGAVFGVKVTHFIAGWKSDFVDQGENVAALLYFAEHASKARLLFGGHRFLDVPLSSVPSTSVLQVSLQIPRPDLLLLLLQNGCNVFQIEIQAILRNILDAANYSDDRVLCFRYLLRSLLCVDFSPDCDVLNPETGEILGRDRLVVDRVLPATRCGRNPIELKHMCRFRIRAILWDNWQLPYGIGVLPLPDALRDYLNLTVD